MASSDDDENNESSGEVDEIMFTCRKCPNVVIRRDELDAHKAMHKRNRAKRKRGSPEPSVTQGSLFSMVSPQRKETPKKRKKAEASGRSPSSRKAAKAAVGAYNKNKGKVMNKKNPGA